MKPRSLRDEEAHRYEGLGVLSAADTIGGDIAAKLIGMSASSIFPVDEALRKLDGTEDFSSMGANTALAVSLACARAASASYHLPLYRYIGGIAANTLPVPMMNLLNGGSHAGNNLDIQEFMVMPTGAESFSQGVEWCCRVYHRLGKLLEQKGLSTAVGDEGGFAPDLPDDEEGLKLLTEAMEDCGLRPGEDMVFALDAAATQWKTAEPQNYLLPKRRAAYTMEQLVEYWEQLTCRYPILSLEDPFHEDDWQGFSQLTHNLDSRVQIVGDDLFATNEKRLSQGITMEAANAVLIKPNQIGTLTQTLETAEAAKKAGLRIVVSHRSGETDDTAIADLAVALNAGQIKAGAPCRGERVAKYNQLLRIQQGLGDNSRWPGKSCFPFRTLF